MTIVAKPHEDDVAALSEGMCPHCRARLQTACKPQHTIKWVPRTKTAVHRDRLVAGFCNSCPEGRTAWALFRVVDDGRYEIVILPMRRFR